VSLLATEAELRILLLALAAAGSSFAAVRLRVVGLEANVEEVFLVGLCDVCALAFCESLVCIEKRLGVKQTYSS
jgi:hypothetical protein